jgi:hypothetical protein
MWPFRADPIHTKFPPFGGSLIVGIGPPRCGKTHTLVGLMCAGILRTGLGAIVLDPTGSVRTTVDSYRAWLLKKKLDKEYTLLGKVVEYYNGSKTDDFVARIEKIVGDGDKPVTDWTGFAFLDDAVVTRERHPGFYEGTVPLFGNVGLLGFATMHHGTAIPPAARQCIRYILAWRAPGHNKIDGVLLDNEDLTKPRTNEVVYFDPADYKRHTFSLAEKPPLKLILPAALTTVKPRVLRY